MRKSNIVCIDGTWNADKGGASTAGTRTNVARVYHLLGNDGQRQRVTYLPGVGTDKGLDRFVGGIWGGGITQKICDGYRVLCESCRPGDQVAMFGFSRGAFAVRAILGVITNVGMVPRDRSDQVEEAVQLYQHPPGKVRRRMEALAAFRESAATYPLDVRFVGVWDTVVRHGPLTGALRHLITSFSRRAFGLFDQQIPMNVRTFRHALALDETRAAFWPWRAKVLDRHPGQDIEEIWFAGSHSDVGGGNVGTSLPDISLAWMVKQAMQAGIEFGETPRVAVDAAYSHLTYMNTGIWRHLKPLLRTVAEGDRMHASVYDRAGQLGYRPAASLPRGFQLQAK